MIARYRLVLNVPVEGSSRSYRTAVDIGRFKTIEGACRRAARVLAKHPTARTRHGYPDLGYSCSLYDAKGPSFPNGRGMLARRAYSRGNADPRLEAPEILVPSVGERGVW